MNSSTLRRLASDHASLHRSELPPYYLFPPSEEDDVPEDLTQLSILLTGPPGTPYSQGLWKLSFKLPDDYPKNPPKAWFRTRIWHPNVEENSGSICVDTLKRDWQPKLTLRDVLVTISCLLIQPNPDSALNANAGQLMQEDYDEFARHAKLMTSIHAKIPPELKDAVLEAKRRGEVNGSGNGTINMDENSPSTRASRNVRSKVVMKHRNPAPKQQKRDSLMEEDANANTKGDADEDELSEYSSKENDPSLSISPVPVLSSGPRKGILGKRPLSDLPTPLESAEISDNDDDDCFVGLSPSERNIAKNNSGNDNSTEQHENQHLDVLTAAGIEAEPPRKALKVAKSDRKTHFSNSPHMDGEASQIPMEKNSSITGTSTTKAQHDDGRGIMQEGNQAGEYTSLLAKKCPSRLQSGSGEFGAATSTTEQACLSMRSKASMIKAKMKPRIGLRRL